MRIIKFLTLGLAFISLLFTSTPQPCAQETQKIAIIVNEEAISTTDVTERLNMVITSSGLPNNDDIRQKLAPQVINNLVEEQIKLQEARRLNIEVNETDIQNGFRTIAQQNQIPFEQFMNMIKQANFSKSTMERQIRAQIAWTKVVQEELRPKIIISQKDIDAAIARIKFSQGQNEYLIAEIFLPVETPSDEGDVKQLAQKLSSEIKAGKAVFFKVAQQFSKAAGAANGGDLGWVRANQLPEEITSTLENLPQNKVSNPVRSTNSYHVLMMRGKRQITADSIPSEDEMYSALGNARLEKLQQRHYMNLRSEAFIESRV